MRAAIFGFILLMLMGTALAQDPSGANNWVIGFSFLAFFIKALLSVVVLSKNPTSRVNRFFSILFISQAVWDLGKAIMWQAPDAASAILWAKISYTGYVISVVLFLPFCWSYLRRKNWFTQSDTGVFLWYLPLIVVVTALWTTDSVISSLFLPSASLLGVQVWSYQYGSIYNYFFVWYQIVPFAYGFYLFLDRYLKSKLPDMRAQLKSFLIGISFPIFIGIPTGVVLPLFGIRLPPHNNILTLLMSIFIAIGIVKYKFLTIKPIAEKVDPTVKIDKDLVKDYRMNLSENYIIKHKDSHYISYHVLLNYLYHNHFGLVITKHDPTRIRKEFKLETTPIVWMTDTETEHISAGPHDISQLYETVEKFTGKVKNSFVLLDGIDYLIKHNNFTKVLKFVKELKKLMERNNCCLIVPKGDLKLNPKEERVLDNELKALPVGVVYRRLGEEVEEIEELRGKIRYVVLGYNDVSKAVLNEFELRGIRATIVAEHLPSRFPKFFTLIHGNPLTRKVLMEAGVDKPSTTIIVALNNDSDTVLGINTLRSLTSTSRIVANINNEKFINVAYGAGANAVVPSSSIGGKLISLALTSPNIVKWIMDSTTYADSDVELLEIIVKEKSAMAGRAVGTVDEQMGRSANILAVRNAQGFTKILNRAYVLQPGDRLVIIANIKEFREKAQKKKVGVKNDLPSRDTFWDAFDATFKKLS